MIPARLPRSRRRGCWSKGFADGQGSSALGDEPEAAMTQTKSRPIAILVFLVLVFPLSWYPWVLALIAHKTSGPNPLGVLVAGLIASAVARGWRGTRDLLLSMVRVGARPLCWAV